MVIGIRKMSLIHDRGNLMLFEETDIYNRGHICGGDGV